jgi:hypothetical protein
LGVKVLIVWIPYEKLVIETDLSLREASEKLTNLLETQQKSLSNADNDNQIFDGTFDGTVNWNKFRIAPRLKLGKFRWLGFFIQPLVTGEIYPSIGGSTVNLIIRPSTFQLFLVISYIVMLAVSIAIRFSIFSLIKELLSIIAPYLSFMTCFNLERIIVRIAVYSWLDTDPDPIIDFGRKLSFVKK